MQPESQITIERGIVILAFPKPDPNIRFVPSLPRRIAAGLDDRRGRLRTLPYKKKAPKKRF
jgi:hypothetical protein